MKFQDISMAVIIILLFVALYVASFLSIGLKKLQKNWPKYRCNPMAMPLASYLGHDPVNNFTQCIGRIQKGLMGHFLEPVYYIIGIIGNMSKTILGAVNKIRDVFFNMKKRIVEMIQSIYFMIINVLIQFQRIIIKMKDLMMKMIGASMTTIYMVEGISLSGKSAHNGPIGGVLRTLCFSPDTKVKMNNGKVKKMKNIKIGDILENDNKVTATLNILGDKYSPYYKIFSKELNDHIYLTGEHLIQHPDTSRFIPVSEYEKAEKTNIRDKVLSCLVTQTHLIEVGEYTFWDWED